MEPGQSSVLDGAAVAAGQTSYVWLLVEMLLVLGVIGLVGWFAVRALSARARAAGTGRVRVLARQSLDPRTELVVVAAGKRALLLGHSASGTPRTLAELDEGDLEAMGLSLEPPSKPPPAGSFREVLARRLGGSGAGGE